MDTDTAPYLTQTMIKLLVRESPMHAWVKNRHLNPNYVEEVSPAMELGKIAHAMLLEGKDIAEPIEFDSFRSSRAQEERDRIRLEGRIPILAKDYKNLEDMVEAAGLQMDVYQDLQGGLTGGAAEVEIVWTDAETGVRCKAKLDYLKNNSEVIIDYKTTSGSAHPDVVSRQLFNYGYDIQACWYLRAVTETRLPDHEPEFFLVTQEVHEPYALSVVALSEVAKWYGDERCREGLRLWKQSIESDLWPGYTRETVRAPLPRWLEKQQLDKQVDTELEWWQ